MRDGERQYSNAYSLMSSPDALGSYQIGVRPTQFQATPISLNSGNADAVSAAADYAPSKRTSLFLEADATFARGGTVGRETGYWAGTPVTDVHSTTRVGVMAGIGHLF